MRTMSLSAKLWTIAATTLLGSILLVAVCVRSVGEVKIRGPLYTDIVMYKDLLADILPPPEYLIESYLNGFELIKSSGKEREKLLEKAEKLEEDFETRRAVWEKDLKNPGLRGVMLTEAVPAGLEFLAIQKSEYLPLLRAGRDEEARKVLEGPLSEAYLKHRAAIDKTVEMANKEVELVEANAESVLSRNMNTIFLAAALINGAVLLLTLWSIRSIMRPMLRLSDYATRVAEGDYDSRCEIRGSREMSSLADVLMGTAAKVKENIQQASLARSQAEEEAQNACAARSQAEEAQRHAQQATAQGMQQAALRLEKVVEVVGAASSQLAVQIEQSSGGARAQAQRAANVATSMEQMNATVLEVATNAAQSAETSNKAQGKAKEGALVVRQVIKGISEVQVTAESLKQQMTDLGRQSENIGQILNVISDIADQTNLLALNAAIEAARAGEAGRGFAVVADEVRKLAEKTMTATKEVGDAILGVQHSAKANIANVDLAVKAIENANSLADRSGMALDDIVRLVETASGQVHSIATAAEEQSAASEEINRSVEEVNSVAAETARTMDEALHAVNALSSQTSDLRDLIVSLKSEVRA